MMLLAQWLDSPATLSLTGTQLVANSSYTYDNAGRLTNLTHARNLQ